MQQKITTTKYCSPVRFFTVLVWLMRRAVWEGAAYLIIPVMFISLWRDGMWTFSACRDQSIFWTCLYWNTFILNYSQQLQLSFCLPCLNSHHRSLIMLSVANAKWWNFQERSEFTWFLLQWFQGGFPSFSTEAEQCWAHENPTYSIYLHYGKDLLLISNCL